MNKVEQNKISDVDASSYSQIDLLKKEVMKLKNTLILKSKELDNLRSQNNSLEGRISELEVSPKVKEINVNKFGIKLLKGSFFILHFFTSLLSNSASIVSPATEI